MAGGLRFDSLADMPDGMRKLAADKIATGTVKAPVGEPSAPEWLCKQMNLPKAVAELPKYHNIKTVVNGIKFDSQKEVRRYQELVRALELGVIEDLRLQVDFTLQEAYTTADGERIRAIRYRADFTYKVVSSGYDRTAAIGWEDIEYWRSLCPVALAVEDVKSRGTKTKEYEIKKKMMADKGYIIREV